MCRLVCVWSTLSVFYPRSDPLIPPEADITYEVELLSVEAPLDVAKVTETELVEVV